MANPNGMGFRATFQLFILGYWRALNKLLATAGLTLHMPRCGIDVL